MVGVPNLQVLSLRHMEYVNRLVVVRLGLWKGSREMDCRDYELTGNTGGATGGWRQTTDKGTQQLRTGSTCREHRDGLWRIPLSRWESW